MNGGYKMTNNKTVFISGAHGMDAAHTIEFLLPQGYKIIGLYRRTSSPTNWRLKELAERVDLKNLIMEAGDLTDISSITRIIKQYKPSYCIHFGAMSQVWHSFMAPLATMEHNVMGTLNVLEAFRQEKPDTKIYLAGSSEELGQSALTYGILNEDSPRRPRSIYGVSKLSGRILGEHYRDAYNMFVVIGTLFNHSSFWRGEEFFTRKVTSSIAKIIKGELKTIKLGNLDAYRDESHAGDMVQGIWLMLKNNKPQDYVLASGETYSCREFLDLAFNCVGMQDWASLVESVNELKRPSDIDKLIGDSSKIRKELGWKPKYTFVDLVHEMMELDLKRNNLSQHLIAKEKVINLW